MDTDGRQWKVVWSFGLSSITPLTPDASCSSCMDSSVRNVKPESSSMLCGTPRKLLRYRVLHHFTYSHLHSVDKKSIYLTDSCKSKMKSIYNLNLAIFENVIWDWFNGIATLHESYFKCVCIVLCFCFGNQNKKCQECWSWNFSYCFVDWNYDNVFFWTFLKLLRLFSVLQVVGNVYNRVGQIYYGFVRPPLRIDRRVGKPRNQHNSELCQACKEGLCKEEWSFTWRHV